LIQSWPLTGEFDIMSYISVEVRAYELTLEDCDTIGRDGELENSGLTEDEACVLRMLFEDEGTMEDCLTDPARLIGCVNEMDE
jgi:hypothetical protein